MIFQDLYRSQRRVIKNFFCVCSEPSAPTALLLAITDRCNSRCIMCKIWEKQNPKELSLRQISKFLDDPLFRSIEHVTLTGGEPTLRADIGSITALIVKKCPKLKNIEIPTNGLAPELVENACRGVDEACSGAPVKYGFSVSLDGLNDSHDRVRGVVGAFEKTSKTIFLLKKLQKEFNFRLHVHCVITKFNVIGLADLTTWCDKQHISLSFEVAHSWKRFSNKTADFCMNTEQKQVFMADLWKRIHGASGTFYDWMVYRMAEFGKQRAISCPFVINALNIQSNGDVYLCPEFDPIGNVLEGNISDFYYSKTSLAYKKLIRRTACSSCTQSWGWTLAFEMNFWQSLHFRVAKKLQYRRGAKKS